MGFSVVWAVAGQTSAIDAAVARMATVRVMTFSPSGVVIPTDSIAIDEPRRRSRGAVARVLPRVLREEGA
jgi:hypothetical protein